MGEGPVIALVDGEHHPAAVRELLDRLERERGLAGVVFCGGEEKLVPGPLEEHYGRSVEPELLKLMRSMGASRLRTLRSVEFPSALPFLFSGLKVAATVSVIGAVFGEWAGADEGLGRLVLLGNNQLQTPRVYAGIVLLTLMAVGLFVLVVLAERFACPWNRKEQSV